MFLNMLVQSIMISSKRASRINVTTLLLEILFSSRLSPMVLLLRNTTASIVMEIITLRTVRKILIKKELP